MPFKSQAQRRKFAQLLVEGKISPQTYEEWNRETDKKKLPDAGEAEGEAHVNEAKGREEAVMPSLAKRGLQSTPHRLSVHSMLRE